MRVYIFGKGSPLLVRVQDFNMINLMPNKVIW